MFLQRIKERNERTITWQVVYFLLFCCLYKTITAQIQYSIPEETKKGFLVGNLAKDLGLNIQDLVLRKFHISSVTAEHFFNVNVENGNLYVAERIDRESVCEMTTVCLMTFEAVVENPLNVFSVEVEIQDINDNPPRFSKTTMNFEITELTHPGTHFVLSNAVDPDIGVNSLQAYKISENEYFKLNEKTSKDGRKYPELVLERPLDREKQSGLEITLTAVDGGNPVKTGTALIKILISDINDNAPVFSEELFQVSMIETAPVNSLVIRMNATDEDEGINGQITYSFSHITKHAQQIFTIDSQNGEIRTQQELDFEITKAYEMTVEAQDGGGLFSHAKLIIYIVDANDNAPEIILTSVSSSIYEDSLPGTVIALVNIRDVDSGDNGKVQCGITDPMRFEITASSGNYFRLLTTSMLDREEKHEYNITIKAEDKGSPPLSTTKTIRLLILDVNDNPPVFDQSRYVAYIPENNPSGSSVFQVHASDPDMDDNGKIIYSIINENADSVLSYISINSMSGVLYAQRPFDYEHQREFDMKIMSRDNGSPSLSSFTTVTICITDQNDNSPKILYPSIGSEGSAVFEIVPRSSNKGDLVAKVVAVDADSGHNAWLSYQFLQTSDLFPFTIGQYTGEIRTLRTFQDREILKHKVAVLVRDNGSPSRSATINLNFIVADNFQQEVPEINSQLQNLDPQANVDIYLVVALALISFLFTLTVMLVIIIKCRRTTYAKPFGSVTTGLYSEVGARVPANFNNATLTFPYSYDVCVALDSTENEFAFLKPIQNVPTENLLDTDDSGLGNNTPNDSSSSDISKEVSCKVI
ncbi:hypothetical protein GDO86_005284 [Hymenochirus boettgeri]|uniref:Cadherin domain-containing protein n=1 Tax=Hymenochirus boettgeri TaxID=247094 RepID=A0A8T2J9B0_9PIPI|nr:hypothetical protein GDO86_005284 [Hymenochirus boettgeri]